MCAILCSSPRISAVSLPHVAFALLNVKSKCKTSNVQPKSQKIYYFFPSLITNIPYSNSDSIFLETKLQLNLPISLIILTTTKIFPSLIGDHKETLPSDTHIRDKLSSQCF